MIPRHLIQFHLWRHWPWARWCAAALLVGLAFWLHASAEISAPLSSKAVVTAARDLPAGHALSTEDLATAPHSWGLAAERRDDLVGRLLREPVTAAAPLSDSQLIPDRSLLRQTGMVTVPLPIADLATATLLTAGDRVDVYAAGQTDPTDPERVGTNLEVLTVRTSEPEASLQASRATALLAVPQRSASQLAALGDRPTTVFLR